jgi:hypothetical protein
MSGGGNPLDGALSVASLGLSDVAQGKKWGSGAVDMAKGLAGMGGKEAPNSGALGGLQGEALAGAQDAGAEYGAQQVNRTAFGNQLAQGAAGTGPSLAQAQLQAANDRSLAQQIAAAKANRAVNPALAARQSAQLGAQMQQATAQQAAQARLQEQRQQQTQYQNYLNSLQNARQGLIGAGTGAASAMAANQAEQNRQNNAMTGNLLNTAATVAPLFLSEGGLVPDGANYAKGALVNKSSNSVNKPVKLADGGVVDIQMQNQNPGYDYYTKMFQGSPMQDSKSLLTADQAKKAMSFFTPSSPAMPGLAGGPMDTGSLSMPTMVAASGAVVPGKPSVKGDSVKNDNVHAMLSPGEMVIPRTAVAKGPDGVKEFAKQLLSQKQQKQEVKEEKVNPFEEVMKAHEALQENLKNLEAKYKRSK